MTGKEAELALFLVRLYRGLDAIVGGDVDAARSWLRSPNTALSASPIDLVQTIGGITSLVMYVDAHRARI